MGDVRVGEHASVRLIRWVGLPVAGVAVGGLLALLAEWLVTLAWVPFRGPLELYDSIPDPWGPVGALGLGLIGGTLLALIAHGERLAVTVSPDRVRLDGDEYTATFERADVTAVFVDGGKLVVLGRDTGELARRPSELDRRELAAAFTEHGFPWREEDPHAGEYRLWVPDMEGLPPGANALLAARAKKLGDDDAKEMRAELVKLGVVVRDDKRRQYWRLTGE